MTTVGAVVAVHAKKKKGNHSSAQIFSRMGEDTAQHDSMTAVEYSSHTIYAWSWW